MQDPIQPVMQCAEVEALLSEALDGALHGPTLEAFEAHQQGCATCRSMVDEARAGMSLLRGLDEAEPPHNLVHNILAQTIGALPSEHTIAKPRGEGWREKLKGRLVPIFAPVVTPRFAMSFGTAFFVITMLLGIAGFHFTDVRHWDLSANGIRKTYYATEARAMRYYENMRLVYEIESRVRDLRHAATPDTSQDNQQLQQQQPPQQEAPAPEQKNPPKSDNRQHDGNEPTFVHDMGQPEAVAYPVVQGAIVEEPGFSAADWSSPLSGFQPRAGAEARFVARAFGTAEAVPFHPDAIRFGAANVASISQARQQDRRQVDFNLLRSENRRTA